MNRKLFKRKAQERIIRPPSLDTFPDFTKKEIFTQGELISELLGQFIKADKIDLDYLKIKADKIKRIYLTGSGVDYACALFGAYNFEVLLDTVAVAVTVGEFMHANPILDKGTLIVLIGENKAVEQRAEQSGARLVKIVPFSDERYAISLGYKSLGAFETAEFTLKLTALTLLALYLGEKKQVITSLYVKIATQMTAALPQKIRQVLSLEFIINELGKAIDFGRMTMTGTNVDYACALYGAHILSNIEDCDVNALPTGELSLVKKKQKSILALASNIDFYNLLDSRFDYLLKIIPSSVDVIDEKTILYEETIPLLNPILGCVIIQLLAYCKIRSSRPSDTKKAQHRQQDSTVQNLNPQSNPSP